MSTSETAGPPVPPALASEVAAATAAAQAGVKGETATGAWKALTDALGRDLQGGMHRAEQARRRLARLR